MVKTSENWHFVLTQDVFRSKFNWTIVKYFFLTAAWLDKKVIITKKATAFQDLILYVD